MTHWFWTGQQQVIMENYLETFCNTTEFSIWSKRILNTNQTIYYLNDCFQQTCLIIPTYLIMSFMLFYYFGLYQSQLQISTTTPTSSFRFIRLVRQANIIFITASYLIMLWTSSQHLSLVSTFTIYLKIFTTLSTILFLRQSDSIFHFEKHFRFFKLSFLLLVIASTSECFTSYLYYNYNRVTFVIHMIILVLWLTYFIFINIQVKIDETTEHQLLINSVQEETIIPSDEQVSVISQLLFAWVTPLLVQGNTTRIDSVHNLFKLPTSLRTQSFEQLVVNYLDSLKSSHQSLARILLVHYGWQLMLLGLFKLLADSMIFVAPIFLNKLLLYLDGAQTQSRSGFIFAFVLFACSLANATIVSIFNFQMSKLSLKIRTILLLTVYNKLYRVPAHVLNCRFGSGKLFNLANTDIDRVVNFAPSLFQFISLPIQLLVTLYLLYNEVGLVFLSGVIFILSLIPLNRYICNKIGDLSQKMMMAKDARVKLMSEIIRGVRTIKMHYWEASFIARVLDIRVDEVHYLKLRKYLDALCVYFWATTPVIISSLVFGSYVLFEGSDRLNSSKVFTSLALLSMLIMPLNALPWVLNGLMETLVSMQRLEKFYFLVDFDFTKNFATTLKEADDRDILKIEQAQFSYECDDDSQASQFNLSIHDFVLPRKSFIGIIGKFKFFE